MSKRDEIIRTYHCKDTYEEACAGDCKECEKEIAEMLDDFAKEIRADAFDEFVAFANTMPTVEDDNGEIRPMWLEEMAEKLKEQKNV